MASWDYDKPLRYTTRDTFLYRAPVTHMCKLHALQGFDAPGIPHISHITHAHTVTAKAMSNSLVQIV